MIESDKKIHLRQEDNGKTISRWHKHTRHFELNQRQRASEFQIQNQKPIGIKFLIMGEGGRAGFCSWNSYP